MRSVFLFVLAFLSLITVSRAQTTNTAEKIRQVERSLAGNIQLEGDTLSGLKERMAHYNIQGVSIAVIHNYKLEWAKGYGWADRDKKIPVTTQTLFQAGSISKSLNAVGVLLLAQRKKIDLYVDINTYLVSWKFPYDSLSKGKKITIANLLSHTAGLTVHGFGGYEKGQEIPTIEQVLDGEKPANSPPVRSMYEPGLKYEYSGGGTTISQLIVMDVTQQTYTQFIYDNVLKPLGMVSSTYQQPPIDKDSALVSAGYYPNGKEITGKYHIYPEQAPAGLWTNPTDLSKYIIETQLAYQGKSEKVLNQQFTKLRLTPYIDKNAALGVFIDSFPDGTKYFEHDGVDEGFISQYYGSFDGGDGVVVMVNTANGGRIIPEIINSVAKVYGFKDLDHSKVIKKITVADSVLQSYIGEYQLSPNFIVTITKEKNDLYGKGSGQGKVRLIPETETKFIIKDVDAEVEFVKNTNGEITKMILYQNGMHEAKKIK